jgi:hypothetical protein
VREPSGRAEAEAKQKVRAREWLQQLGSEVQRLKERHRHAKSLIRLKQLQQQADKLLLAYNDMVSAHRWTLLPFLHPCKLFLTLLFA